VESLYRKDLIFSIRIEVVGDRKLFFLSKNKKGSKDNKWQ
jgi:hypothetical protein